MSYVYLNRFVSIIWITIRTNIHEEDEELCSIVGHSTLCWEVKIHIFGVELFHFDAFCQKKKVEKHSLLTSTKRKLMIYVVLAWDPRFRNLFHTHL